MVVARPSVGLEAARAPLRVERAVPAAACPVRLVVAHPAGSAQERPPAVLPAAAREARASGKQDFDLGLDSANLAVPRGHDRAGTASAPRPTRHASLMLL